MLNMVQPDCQWLYIITDIVINNSTNITSLVDLLSEGSNVAFIYNATDNNTYCNVIYYSCLIIYVHYIHILYFNLIARNKLAI